MRVDPNHIAWAAGFFDGEGSVSAVLDNRRGGTYTVTMTVVQVGTETQPPDTLLRFQNIAGVGRISRRGEKGQHLGKKPQWVWRLYNIDDVRGFSRRLYPYLGQAKADKLAQALACRAENEGLARDRGLFCKVGHARESRGESTRPFRCWECHNEYARNWKRSRRLTAAQTERR